MSAFHFINTKKSLTTTPSQQSVRQQRQKSNLSASLADDFFSDQFASFVNQSSPSSSSSSLPGLQEQHYHFDVRSRTNSNGTGSQYAETNPVSQQHQHRHYDKRITTTTTNSPIVLSPVKKSAFSFISASCKSFFFPRSLFFIKPVE